MVKYRDLLEQYHFYWITMRSEAMETGHSSYPLYQSPFKVMKSSPGKSSQFLAYLMHMYKLICSTGSLKWPFLHRNRFVKKGKAINVKRPRATTLSRWLNQFDHDNIRTMLAVLWPRWWTIGQCLGLNASPLSHRAASNGTLLIR